MKEVMVFSSPYEVRLKCFREISEWMQNDWHSYVKNVSVIAINAETPNDENDTINNTHDDSIVNFMNEDEDLNKS